jgi:hypothetical protein
MCLTLSWYTIKAEASPPLLSYSPSCLWFKHTKSGGKIFDVVVAVYIIRKEEKRKKNLL